MISKDGEEVAFKRPFPVADSGVKEWLKALETEMRSTLALLLREAVGATGDLSTSKEDAGVSVRLHYFEVSLRKQLHLWLVYRDDRVCRQRWLFVYECEAYVCWRTPSLIITAPTYLDAHDTCTSFAFVSPTARCVYVW